MSVQRESNIIKVKSNIGNNFIYVKTRQNGMSQMWFTDDVETTGYDPTSYQTIYNRYDLDKFYLTYFYPLFMCFNYINVNIKRCLCVGLGGGHIPLFLQKKYPNLQIDVVEIDNGVFTASKHMGFSESDNIKIYIEDGINFIENSIKMYDVIIIDLDGEESFNFTDVSNILEENGIVAINSYYLNKNDRLKNKIKQIFNCIKYYELEHNDVFLCKKNLNEFYKMMDPINASIPSPIFEKYKNDFITVMSGCKSSIILS